MKKFAPVFAAILTALSSQAAFAQAQAQDNTTPWYVGVSGGLTHLSNVYRAASGTSQADRSNSDIVATGSLLGGLDQRFGRQHLTADGSISGNRYQHNRNLDNIGYSGRAGLDWYTVENISGNVTVGGSRQLSNNNVGYGYVPQYEKNVVTDNYASFVAHKGVVTEWTLDVGADYQRRKYSNDYYRPLDYSQHDVWIGPSWRPSDKLRLGVDYRLTNGEIPYYTRDLLTGQTTANSFKRHDVDFTGTWVMSGASTLDWRLSRGNSKHQNSAGEDSSHTTGQVSWIWRPTGKLAFTTQFVHDTGLQTSFLSVLGYSYSSYAQDQVVNTLRVSSTYQYSGKLSFGANASYSPSSLRTTPSGGTTPTVYDFRDYSLNLSAGWQYSRGISMSCQAGRQWRTGPAALYPYTANSIGCSGQILFY
ncbi:hypothetical protein ACFJGW_10620 [Burkholderiaceae bacterium UC74_6]